MRQIWNFLRGIGSYLWALLRPGLRLQPSSERWLVSLILAALTVLATFAALLPLKIAAGGAYDARGVEGHLVVHVLQGTTPLEEFEGQLDALIARLGDNEAIARVSLATGPELAQTMEILFGSVAREDLLYGGIVRLDLVERAGRNANVEDLQFAIRDFASAHVDDFRSWKEASARRARHALGAGLFVVALTLGLVVALLNLTISLGLRMHESVLRVLHQLGATDSFAALLFQALTLRRAALGLVVGAGVSLVLLWGLNGFLQLQGYVGAAQVGRGQIMVLALMPLFLLILAVATARHAARSALRQLY